MKTAHQMGRGGTGSANRAVQNKRGCRSIRERREVMNLSMGGDNGVTQSGADGWGERFVEGGAEDAAEHRDEGGDGEETKPSSPVEPDEEEGQRCEKRDEQGGDEVVEAGGGNQGTKAENDDGSREEGERDGDGKNPGVLKGGGNAARQGPAEGVERGREIGTGRAVNGHGWLPALADNLSASDVAMVQDFSCDSGERRNQCECEQQPDGGTAEVQSGEDPRDEEAIEREPDEEENAFMKEGQDQRTGGSNNEQQSTQEARGRSAGGAEDALAGGRDKERGEDGEHVLAEEHSGDGIGDEEEWIEEQGKSPESWSAEAPAHGDQVSRERKEWRGGKGDPEREESEASGVHESMEESSAKSAANEAGGVIDHPVGTAPVGTGEADEFVVGLEDANSHQSQDEERERDFGKPGDFGRRWNCRGSRRRGDCRGLACEVPGDWTLGPGKYGSYFVAVQAAVRSSGSFLVMTRVCS